MLLGFALGVLACAIWGLIYIFPLVLPDYHPVIIASARFAMYGLTCLMILPLQIKELKKLTRSDWWVALRLAFFGSLVYYFCLVISVKLSGAPICGMLMCWIPVLVAIVANYSAKSEQKVPWSRLAMPLALIIVGMFVANWSEFEYITEVQQGSPLEFGLGVAAGVASLLLWTWFPIRNARWLLDNKGKSPKVWATAQGLSVFPVSTLGFFIASFYFMPQGQLLGPDPVFFVLMMIVAGVCCSWLGAVLWNGMSQRLPPALGGQLIVFETIFSVLYALLWRGQWPTVSLVVGMMMLLLGVLLALRVFRNTEV